MNKELIKKKLCERFVSTEKFPRFVLGKNPFAKSVISALSVSTPIQGVIDEFTKDIFFEGLPIVHSLSNIPSNSIVLSAALLNPVTVNRKLENAGVLYIDYFSLLHFCPDFPIKKICFWENFQQSYTERRKEYDSIYDQLADDQSKDIFRRIIDFRFNYNVEAMDIFCDRQKEQYFEPFLNLRSNCSFVDVGGYDGFTTIEFIKRCPDYKSIWFFEPEDHNMKTAKHLLKNYARITYCPVAASDKEETLHFEPSNDSSKVLEDGSVVVDASLIDKYVVPQKDLDNKYQLFMKMDIEGAEGRAITGAKNTIRDFHPIMAISVYHKGADLIDIPKQIFEIRSDYEIYLRHYTEGISETVMFFVPKTI